MEYKAIVTYQKKVIITGESKTKAAFAKELRRRGYKVDPRFVKEKREFDYITEKTNGTIEDWARGMPKEYKEDFKHYKCFARHRTNDKFVIKDGFFRTEKDFIDYLHAEGYEVRTYTVKLKKIFEYILFETDCSRGDWDRNYDKIVYGGE